jgi:hypothetical protein
LEILDVEMEIRTATGPRKVTRFRAIMENLVANAAKGNPTSLNHLMRLMLPALEERVKAHPQVRIAEFLRDESDSPDPERQVSYKAVRDQLNTPRKNIKPSLRRVPPRRYSDSRSVSPTGWLSAFIRNSA